MGGGGATQSASLTVSSQFFFLWLPLLFTQIQTQHCPCTRNIEDMWCKKQIRKPVHECEKLFSFMFSFLSGRWYCAGDPPEHLAGMVRPRMGDISLLLRCVGGKTISRTWVYWGGGILLTEPLQKYCRGQNKTNICIRVFQKNTFSRKSKVQPTRH